MIDAAVADVIGPSVAAEDPGALAHEEVGYIRETMRIEQVEPCEPFPERLDARTLCGDGGFIATASGQITGGVAEALIATACGLFIAITALLPFNYLNARIEEAKHEVADASNALELIIKKSETNAPFSR